MPILDISGTDLKDNTVKQPENTESERVFRSQEELKTSLLFSKDRDLYNIVQQIKGMSWEVDYFAQLRNINDDHPAPDINLTPGIQKYHRINNLLLKVQSAINQDIPNNITGEAYLNAGIVPNPNDVFKATLTGGREAMFIVTDVNNNTYNLQNIFLINFKLLFFVESNPKLYHDIQLKTVAKYKYNKDYIKDYSAPLILEEQYSNIIDLNNVKRNLVDFYLKTFTSTEDTTSVIHLPIVNHSLAVDPYLENFIFRILGVDDNILLRDITRIHIPEENNIIYTLWDLLLDKNINNINRVDSNINWDYVDYYNKTYVSSRNLLFMGVKYTIQKYGRVELNILESKTTKPNDYEEPIRHDNKYVFGTYFYKRDKVNCGILERSVLTFLEGKKVEYEELNKMLEQCYSWNIQDQYYGIPILILLIKDFINNTYKAS